MLILNIEINLDNEKMSLFLENMSSFVIGFQNFLQQEEEKKTFEKSFNKTVLKVVPQEAKQ